MARLAYYIFVYVLLVFVMWVGVYETEEKPFMYSVKLVTLACAIAFGFMGLLQLPL